MISKTDTSFHYLGLDISTSCTGLTLITGDGKLVEARYVYLSDEKTTFKKASIVKAELERYKDYNIKCVTIEQNMLGFRQGSSSAGVLISLARFNGVVSYLVSDVLKLDPIALSVLTARKNAHVPIVRGINAKEQVTKWVTEREPNYKWPTRTMKAGVRKGVVIFEKGVEDACDAYVMAHAAMNLNLSSEVITILK